MKHINAAAKDYVERQFKSPQTITTKPKEVLKSKPKYNKPPDKTLQCCKCGTQHDFPDGVEYEDIAACTDDDCIGQCFCNKWDGWEDNKEELAKAKIVSV